MILSSAEIKSFIESSDIIIRPFSEENINPNSYDVRLGDTLAIYKLQKYGKSDNTFLDVKGVNMIEEFKIPEEGCILEPGTLYLGSTLEYTETHKHVPSIIGKSSVGRLGIFIHVTAGLGDVGFCGNWTLEITVVERVKVYAGMKIGQIVYDTITSDGKKYNGKYQHATTLEASKSYKDNH